MEHPHAVVVGAGLGGLAAAWCLASRGFSVTVLERAAQPGGRATSAEANGVAFDPAAHRVVTTDRRLRALVEASGLGDAMLPIRPVARAQVYRGCVVPVEPTGLLGVARTPGLRLHEALRLVRLPRLVRHFGAQLDPEAPERAAVLDDRGVEDFGRLYFGRSVVDRWMQPTLDESAPADAIETSRVAFLLRYVKEHWATPGTLRLPVGQLADALGSHLRVRVGSRVEHLEPLRHGGFAVHLGRIEGNARTLRADAVVVAVPAPEALRVAEALLGSAERQFLAHVRYGAAITWTAGLDASAVGHATRVRVPRVEGIALAALAMESLPETHAAGVGGLATLVARSAWSRSRLDAPDEAIGKELAFELARLYPAAAAAIRFACVHRVPEAFPSFDVGRYRALARFRKVSMDRRATGRRLYFAGDYLIAPSLEGAVVSGLRAAEEVLEDFGAPSA